MKTQQFLQEFIIFTLNQARASVFGALLLLVMILTSFVSFESIGLSRYDTIFLIAILIQVYLIARKHESRSEVIVIFLFHIVATVMELFKTHPEIGSWTYSDGGSYFMIATVPLFTGFLYSSVGSYIARAWRIFRFHFTDFPRMRYSALLSFLIYVNFFTHHYTYDIRWPLFLFACTIFYKTKIYFTMVKTPRNMPLLLGFALVAFFLYVAENIGTALRVWTYPNQEAVWHLVPIGKYGSWFLLIIVSFTLVSLIYRKKIWRNRNTLT